MNKLYIQRGQGQIDEHENSMDVYVMAETPCPKVPLSTTEIDVYLKGF